MASRDTVGTRPKSTDMDTFPNPQVAQSDAGDVASILSSRMTDIASDDGGEYGPGSTGRPTTHVPGQRRSVQTTTGEGASRPNTAMTGVSSQRGTWGQTSPSRRGHAPSSAMPRSNIGSVSGSTGTRPQSSSRTHVPSLTSHAFFHPMSSQRLQAQRGARPAIPQQSEDGSAEGGSSVARHSVNSNATARQGGRRSALDDDGRPPSRGTEMTEQETTERRTANTSPIHGHHATGSLSESVRPLQRNPNNNKGLSLNVDKSYKNGGSIPTPAKSPRSFRSSFLLPSRGDGESHSPNRSTQGREKLSSVASSPGLAPADVQKPVLKPKNLGSNYQYFSGNTVFWLGGRLQNTRDKPVNIATGSFVVIPGALFFIFSASWLWHNISPAIPILFAYVFYICLSSFIHASVSDPGVSRFTQLVWHYANIARYSLEISTQCRPKTKMRTLWY
jgi:palmitoyltransferase ZDHHC9/14/18